MGFLDAQVLNKPEIMIGGMPSRIDPTTHEITDEATAGLVAQQLVALAAMVR